VVLTSSYIKDALELHGGHSSSKTKVGISPNLYPEMKVGRIQNISQRRNYSSNSP